MAFLVAACLLALAVHFPAAAWAVVLVVVGYLALRR
jgi:hypothetical protein